MKINKNFVFSILCLIVLVFLFFPRGGNNYSLNTFNPGGCPECPTTNGSYYDFGLPYAWLEHSSETIEGGNYGGPSKNSEFAVNGSELVFDAAVLGGVLLIFVYAIYRPKMFSQKQ